MRGGGCLVLEFELTALDIQRGLDEFSTLEERKT